MEIEKIDPQNQDGNSPWKFKSCSYDVVLVFILIKLSKIYVSRLNLCLKLWRWFQVKTDIAFLAFFKILDKNEDNSSLRYHCGVKFEGDKI